MDAEKAIDLAARKWADLAKDALKTGKRVRIQLDTIIRNRTVEYIDLPSTPRLIEMAA